MTTDIINSEAKLNSNLNSFDQNRAPLAPAMSDTKLNHAQASSKNSSLGKALFIKGAVTASEDVLINGRVEGVIELKNNRIEVGVSAHIEANTYGKVVIICGEVKGNIYASDQVVIRNTGRVFGNIFATNVSIEDGAVLKGKINKEELEAPVHHHIAPDLLDEHAKASSLTSIFKRVQEIAHLHSKPHDLMGKDDAESAAMHVLPATAMTQSLTKDLVAPMAEVNAAQQIFSEQSIIGSSTLIKGELVADEDVVIQGRIEGIIYFKNNSLEISPGAQVKANIFVKSLVSYGDIKGDIYASEHVSIRKSGHLQGNILSPRIVIESGAVVTGSVEMEKQNIEKVFSSMSHPSVAGKENTNTTSKSEHNANAHAHAQANVHAQANAHANTSAHANAKNNATAKKASSSGRDLGDMRSTGSKKVDLIV